MAARKSSQRPPPADTSTPGSPGERRARSHEAIIKNAARMIRERGIDGSSVDEIMAAAGLTRGGFYAHFEDKIDLVRAAIERTLHQSLHGLFGPQNGGPEDWKRSVVTRYLSDWHLDSPGYGCPAPTLASEIARSDPRLKMALEKGMLEVFDGVTERIGGDPRTARPRAFAFIATCVGAVSLARAMGTRETAREIMDSVRKVLLDDFEDGAPRARSEDDAPRAVESRGDERCSDP